MFSYTPQIWHAIILMIICLILLTLGERVRGTRTWFALAFVVVILGFLMLLVVILATIANW